MTSSSDRIHRFAGTPREIGRAAGNAVSVLSSLAREARHHGIALGPEICNRYETNVVNTGRQAQVLADAMGEDNVVIHLEKCHVNIEEDDLVRPVHEVGDRPRDIHIGENHRGYLGSGLLEVTGSFTAWPTSVIGGR